MFGLCQSSACPRHACWLQISPASNEPCLTPSGCSILHGGTTSCQCPGLRQDEQCTCIPPSPCGTLWCVENLAHGLHCLLGGLLPARAFQEPLAHASPSPKGHGLQVISLVKQLRSPVKGFSPEGKVSEGGVHSLNNGVLSSGPAVLAGRRLHLPGPRPACTLPQAMCLAKPCL